MLLVNVACDGGSPTRIDVTGVVQIEEYIGDSTLIDMLGTDLEFDVDIGRCSDMPRGCSDIGHKCKKRHHDRE